MLFENWLSLLTHLTTFYLKIITLINKLYCFYRAFKYRISILQNIARLLSQIDLVKKTSIFKKTSILFFTHIIQNNTNISMSLDLIFFNKRRMIHHNSISSL